MLFTPRGLCAVKIYKKVQALCRVVEATARALGALETDDTLPARARSASAPIPPPAGAASAYAFTQTNQRPRALEAACKR